MNSLNKAINMILRGNIDKFKIILEETLQDRAGILLEQIYKEKSKKLLHEIESLQFIVSSDFILENTKKPEIPSSFTTKDGVFINLTPEQIDKISKLHENLNSNSKERLIKLLTESEEAVNRILNLSKIERKSNVK